MDENGHLSLRFGREKNLRGNIQSWEAPAVLSKNREDKSKAMSDGTCQQGVDASPGLFQPLNGGCPLCFACF